jgi:hypothetical protein
MKNLLVITLIVGMITAFSLQESIAQGVAKYQIGENILANSSELGYVDPLDQVHPVIAMNIHSENFIIAWHDDYEDKIAVSSGARPRIFPRGSGVTRRHSGRSGGFPVQSGLTVLVRQW